MNGPRQIEIPPVVPGEPLGQTLVNSLIGAANNFRMASGDGGVNVSNVGGIVGISNDAKQLRGDKDYLVQVIVDATLPPGFYYGRFFMQPVVQFASASNGSTTTPVSPIPIPNANLCFVVNLPEVSTVNYGSTTSPIAISRTITTNRITVGRMVGFMDSTGLATKYPPAPLLAVDIGSGGGNSTVTFNITGNESVNCMYTAKTYTDSSGGTISLTSGTLTSSSFGTLAGSNNAIVLVTNEALGYSNSGHDVTATTNGFSTVGVGRIVDTRSDGAYIIHATMPYTGCTS